jgi:hypothetical protein
MRIIKLAFRTAPLLAILIVLPQFAMAWSGFNNVNIVSLTIYQNGKASPPGGLLQFSGGTGSDNEGCTNSGKGYAWIDWGSGTPDGSTLYATVLAAEMAGKQVGIGLNGCNSVGNPVIYAINTYP